MNKSVRLCGGLAFLIVLALNPATRADDEQLELAQGLFEMHEYLAAQEVLLDIDRDQLTEDEAGAYDYLLQILPEAIRASAKAEQDTADADKAYEEGRWQDADALYAQVIENEYASPALSEEALAQRQRIAEKLELAEAAKPAGPVQPPAEPEPVDVEQPEAEAQQPEMESIEEPVPIEPPRPVTEAEGPTVAEPAAERPVAAPPPAKPRRRTLVDDLRARDDLLWQRAVAKMQEAAQKANDAVAAERFDEARQLAERALQVIEANRAYAQPPSKYEAARDAALGLKKSVADAYDRWSRSEAERQRARHRGTNRTPPPPAGRATGREGPAAFQHGETIAERATIPRGRRGHAAGAHSGARQLDGELLARHVRRLCFAV